MRKQALIFTFLGCLITIEAYSQNREMEKQRQMEEVIEAMAEAEESAVENNADLDELNRLVDHPLNLNVATREELERLLFLDFGQISRFLAYRDHYGPLKTIYELSVIEGFNEETLRKILPFVVLGEKADTTAAKYRGPDQRLYLRARSSFPESRGYSSVDGEKPAAYPGAPVGYNLRYKAEWNRKMELGFTADQDAGEPFFTPNNRQGFDFYSAHFVWKGKGSVRQINLGDYHLRLGQGLNFWSGYGINKSVESLGIMRSGQGAKAFTSSDENGYLRGGAVTLAKGAAKLLLFYSNKRRDANLDEDDNGQTLFTSLQTSGLHRTSFEQADENSVRETLAGLYTELRFERFRIGATGALQHFSLPMTRGDAPYKAKSFDGDENFNLGVDYQWAFGHIQLFGEAGLSKSLKPAAVQGAVARLHPQFNLALFYRYLDPEFHTFYGNVLSEGSANRNESGLYTGFEWLPVKKVRITGYADYFRFPWLTYSTVAPAKGHDLMLQFNYRANRKWELIGRIKQETKPQKESGAGDLAADYDETTGKIRLQSHWQITDRLALRHRIEMADYHYRDNTESGYLAFQDLIYSPTPQLHCWFRYAWYRTDSYNSRVYAYENDLLYYYAIPAFYGEGSRVYLNLKWQPTKAMTCYIKGGYTLRKGVDSMGSGHDETRGNHRTELRALLYLRF